MIRRLRWFLAVIASLAATLAGWAVLASPFLPILAEWGAERYLSSTLGRPVSLHVASIGPNGARVEQLTIGDAVRVDAAELLWHVSELLGGTIASVAVDGLSARADMGEGGVSLGPLDELFGSGEGGLRIESWRLARGKLLLGGPWGERVAIIRGSGDADGAMAAAEFEDTRVEWTSRGTADGSTGQVWVQGPWARGFVDFTVSDEGLSLTMPEPLALELERVPDWLAVFAPAPVLSAIRGPARVVLDGIGDAPAQVRLTRMDGGPSLFAARLRLRYGGGEAAQAVVELDGEATLSEPAPRIAVERLSAEIAALPFAGGAWDGVLRIAGYQGTTAEGDAQVRLHLVGRDIETEGGAAEQVALTTTGRLHVDGQRISLSMEEPGTAYLAGVRLGEMISTLAPASLQLGTGAVASIELERSATGGFSLIPDVPVQGRVLLDMGGVGVDVDLGEAHLRGAWTLPDGPHLPVITITGATLRSPDLGLGARGVDAVYALSAGGPEGNLEIGELRRQAGDREGLALSGTAQMRSEGGRLAFSAALEGAGDKVKLTMEGHHDLAEGHGEASLSMPPAPFGPDLRPADLFPALARDLGEASGTVAVGGTIDWTAAGVDSDLKVAIRDYSGRLGGVAIGRLNTDLRVTGLSPLRTPAGQSLSVALIDAGLPLADGVMSYGIDGGVLAIGQARTHLAGGIVRMGATRLDFAASRQRLALDVDGVDLSRLIALVELEGLHATGSLTGRIPLLLDGDSVAIADASLASTIPGILRYRPSTPPAGLVGAGESMQLLLKALDDFHYDELTMTLNGRTGGELVATMKIKGANPDLYGGYPIEFNLNVAGKLGSILDDAVSSYQIPERIRERMSDPRAR